MSNKIKDESFVSTHFFYQPEADETIPAFLTFRANQKKYKITFDRNKEWEDEVENLRFPHEKNVVLGRIIGETMIFKIKRGTQTITWRRIPVDYENIII